MSSVAEVRAEIVSIQIGVPERFGGAAEGGKKKCWTSAIAKRPIDGPVAVGRLGLRGDAQADLVHHGGPDKAVLAYSADHYLQWHIELPRLALAPGAFGENLTVQGITEHDVCIGDRWQSDDLLLEITQPRTPCWKLARRWNQPDLPKRVTQSHRSGWYLRVIHEGTVRANSVMTLVTRPHPTWTIARIASAMYGKVIDPELARALAELPGLSDAWRADFAARGDGGRNGVRPIS